MINSARKIIASIFFPILVGIPVLSIEIKQNLNRTEHGSTWNPVPLSEYPMAWWGLALVTAAFLMFLWGDKTGASGRCKHEDQGATQED